MGDHGRLVYRAGLHFAVWRGVCASGAVRAALLKKPFRKDGKDWIQRGQLRAQSCAAPDTEKERYGFLCIHAAEAGYSCI